MNAPDSGIRAGIALRGATPSILMLAILIASIGRNINSNAMIIGAMLVSPRMGPIIGLGYGAGPRCGTYSMRWRAAWPASSAWRGARCPTSFPAWPLPPR